MSSYDSSANKIWVPKKANTGGRGIRSTTLQDRSLVHHKNKSFSEWGNAAKTSSSTRSSRSPSLNSSQANSPIFHYNSNYSQFSEGVPSNYYLNIPQIEPKIKVKKHRRSASETYNERDETFMKSPDNVVSEGTDVEKNFDETPYLFQEVPVVNETYMMKPNRNSTGREISTRRSNSPKYHSWSKHSSKQNKRNRPSMVDASTQTTADVGTQTLGYEYDDNEEYMLQAARLLLLGAHQSKKGRLSVKSVSFNGGSIDDGNSVSIQTGSGEHVSENILLNDLNDLEEEIAMMRFKALSLHEQMRWLNQEKKARPNAPVVGFDPMSSQIFGNKNSFRQSFIAPQDARTFAPQLSNFSRSPPVEATTKLSPTIEFTNDKPGIDRCYSPVVSVLAPIKDAAMRFLQVKSPDHSKRQDIARDRVSAFSSGASAFTGNSLTKNTRLTKSLGALPELPILGIPVLESPSHSPRESPRLSRSSSVRDTNSLNPM